MNNAQLATGGTLLSSKHNNTKNQPAFHHSLHNLAQLPPSYESATKPELNFYSQCLKKGSSHFTISSLLDPDITSDYHSPTEQRELFPSVTTLNISHSGSSTLD